MPKKIAEVRHEKTFTLEVIEKRKDGGRILINTASVDRDRDRVMPGGANVSDYLKNPVVQWGHNYRDPWATVGNSNSLTITEDGIVSDFTLRPAANEHDPQNIVILLWEGGWVKTASIGFIPRKGAPNAEGGTDFTAWDLLEWSIVPIPANQDALRLAYKSLEAQGGEIVINQTINQSDVTALVEKIAAEFTKDTEQQVEPRAWLRRLTLETGSGIQTVFAAFYKRSIAVPEDATVTQWDFTLDECKEIPHPDAGKTVTFKIARFTPAIKVSDIARGYTDSIFGRNVRDCEDQDVLGKSDLWSDLNWSEIVDSIDAEQALKSFDQQGFEDYTVETLTDNGLKRARLLLAQRAQRFAKRGRVLSSKNESTIREAQQDARSAADKLDDVLKQLDTAPTVDDEKSKTPTQITADTLAADLELSPEDERALAASLSTLTNLLKEKINE